MSSKLGDREKTMARREARCRAIRAQCASLTHPCKGAPGPDDWLFSFPESGQTVEEFLSACSRRLVRVEPRIVVIPLGPFTPGGEAVLEASAAFAAAFFGCEGG